MGHDLVLDVHYELEARGIADGQPSCRTRKAWGQSSATGADSEMLALQNMTATRSKRCDPTSASYRTQGLAACTAPVMGMK